MVCPHSCNLYCVRICASLTNGLTYWQLTNIGNLSALLKKCPPSLGVLTVPTVPIIRNATIRSYGPPRQHDVGARIQTRSGRGCNHWGHPKAPTILRGTKTPVLIAACPP